MTQPTTQQPAAPVDRKTKCLLVFAIGHIVLVAMGALGYEFRTATIPPTRAVGWYAAMTGANNRYSFFAPGVDTPTRVAFTMRDEDTGREWTETLEFGHTSEANLRLATVAFALPMLDENDQRSMLRSLASTMLKQHRDADTVVVNYQWLGVANGDEVTGYPGMAEFRQGNRAEWVTLSATEPLRIEGVLQ